MDGQTPREIWDFPASEESKKMFTFHRYHGVTANLKNKQIEMKRGIGISTIWIMLKERTNYSK